VQTELPRPEALAPEIVQRARRFGMPPLDRNRVAFDPIFHRTLDGILDCLTDRQMPETASAALGRVRAANDAVRESMARDVLDFAIPFEALAEHGYVAAAMQVHLARCAALLDAKALVPVRDGACPVCGGAPVASMVVGWQGAHGTRYCGCSLCGTLWNYVRIKCGLCASTAGIAYREIDGGPGSVKAETCESCGGYLKVMQQHKDPHVELVADDVASLPLDLLVREAGYRRGGVNPFLVGY
jgi:FdhE protein